MIYSAAAAGSAADSTARGPNPPAGAGGIAAGAATGRYASALKLLSINVVVTNPNSASAGAFQSGGGGDPMELASIAAMFEKMSSDLSSSDPFSPEANRRHITQYETIMAHRGSFPPGEFYIHTELGDGASITTRVPSIGETNEPAGTSRISLSVTAIMASIQTSAGSVTATSVQAAYAEWS